MSLFPPLRLSRVLSWLDPGRIQAAAASVERVEPVAVALALIRRFEGLYLQPYLCPAGVPTIGYGSTFYENGTPVRLTDAPITRERAEALLLWSVQTIYLPAVARLCPGSMTAGQAAALIDFTFNLGASKLAASTLRRRVNDRDWDSAKVQLRRWNRANGRVLRGLVLRREAECELI